MSRETLQESLSAVMDNQADELELRRVLAASDDPELRATWMRYQLARAVMHKDLLEPRLDIAAAVSAALADEPAHTAATPQRGVWRSVGRLAVAASVTVAVLAGVRLYNQDDIAGAGKGRRDAREAGAIGGRLQRWQAAPGRPAPGGGADCRKGKLPAVPAVGVKGARLDRGQQGCQPVVPVREPGHQLAGSRISASCRAGTNSKKRSPGYSACWSASV